MKHTIDTSDPGAPRRRASVFNFDIMLTPLLIKLGFLLGVISFLVAGIVQWIHSAGEPPLLRHGGALVTILLGPVILRIWCEFVIIPFKIFEELRRQR